MDIKERSEDELRRILAYLVDRDDGTNPTVLVGGWAVYAYNPYEKSTDIDLVLGAKRRGRLLHWLQHEHGYARIKKHRDGWQGTWKDFPGPEGDERKRRIYVDIAGYDEDHLFEGSTERLDFSLVQGHCVPRNVGGTRVKIPTRSLLLLFKAKACHDRATRLANGTSVDVTYDQDKLVKDRSDGLAILDSGVDGRDWEVGFLGDQLTRLPFLIGVLQKIPTDASALQRYRHGRLDRGEAAKRIEDLLAIVT